MVLRAKTIRLGIFISTVIITAIVMFQLIWLWKVYNFEQKNFDLSIARAVRNFFDDVNIKPQPGTHLSDLISRYNNNTYVVRSGDLIASDSVVSNMHNELEDQDVFTDCYIGFYNAKQQQYTQVNLLPAAASPRAESVNLPVFERSYNNITLYFPHRKQYILSLMNFWLITTGVLLIVLILFGASLYYFYRQKFLNEIQKDFTNNFTHEFKTPVSIISLAAETLENPAIVDKPEKLSKYAGIVKYQSKYLQDHIERLLSYAYAESNNLALTKQNVHLHTLIEDALRNLQPLKENKHAEIECNLRAANDLCNCDRGYLLIVIINLIDNALKYSNFPKILITSSNENGSFVLSIKDNGRGIDQQHLNKIFKKFYRVTVEDQSTGRGFGLGLAFVKRIIDSHHGKISVESIPDVGSNFIVKLPVS